MNRYQVLAELQTLKLTSGQYVVVGGAALAIRDIRDTVLIPRDGEQRFHGIVNTDSTAT